MKLTLSENIRLFRKQRKMTQEKLAEALGVTVGAVYKWESGQSQPELNMVVEMADFFDTSVDVLLGYRMKDNSVDAAMERITKYCQTLDPAALAEAEKTLAKYPHSFRAVYGCASIYLAFGVGCHDRECLRRAMELLERGKVLLPQNDDPRISEATISGDLSTVWFLLGEKEKGIDLLKRSNAGGMFSGEIGALMAVYTNAPEEASPFLSEALTAGVSGLLTVILGYVFVFRSRKDWDSAIAILTWGIGLLEGVKTEARPDFLEKTHSEMLILLAYVQAKAGMRTESSATLQKARNMADRFDSGPYYSLQAMRFTDRTDQSFAVDIFGATASEGIGNLLDLLADPALSEQWKQTGGNKS